MRWITIKEIEELKKKRKIKKIVRTFDKETRAQGLESLIQDFRAPALEYVKQVADYIVSTLTTDSIQFDTLFYNALSHDEVTRIKQNVAQHQEPMGGIAYVENGKYDVDKVIGLYDVAKLAYASNIKRNLPEEKQKYFAMLEIMAESSSLYKHFHGDNGKARK
jgi:hypothetical protein